MNRIHIVYGESGAAMLRLTLSDLGQEQEQVAAFPEILQYAPLFSDFSEKALCDYAKLCCQMFVSSDDGKQMHGSIMQFIRTDFSVYDDIVVWSGDSVGDRLFYAMCCELVARPMLWVNVGEVRELLPNRNLRSISLAVCSVENINSLIKEPKPLLSKDIQSGREQWQRWSHSQAALRLLGATGEIVEADEDIFDEMILDSCRGEWQIAARVVGRLLCGVDFAVGDSFLHRRMVELARCGRLEVRTSERFLDKAGSAQESVETTTIVSGVDMSEIRLFDVKS